MGDSAHDDLLKLLVEGSLFGLVHEVFPVVIFQYWKMLSNDLLEIAPSGASRPRTQHVQTLDGVFIEPYGYNASAGGGCR